ncbi:MAG: hypothetical protein ACTHLE_25955 [Agriterribacter sp.]
MTGKEYSRRQFMKRAFFSISLSGAAILLHSCGGDKKNEPPPKKDTAAPAAGTDPCKDFTGVPQEEMEKRKSMGYVDKSPVPESSCGNCGLYIPFSEKSPCGKCLLFKGPVLAEGHCLQWVAKTQAG